MENYASESWPGVQAALSEVGLRYAKDVLVTQVLEELVPLSIPDMSLVLATPLGHVAVNLSDIVLWGATVPDSALLLDEESRSITVYAGDVVANLSCAWSFELGQFLSDSGNASVFVDGLHVVAVGNLSNNEGGLVVGLDEVGCAIEHLEISLLSPYSWFYSWLEARLPNHLKSAVQTQMDWSIRMIVDELNEFLQALPRVIPVDCTSSLNVSVPVEPYIQSRAVTLACMGQFVPSGGHCSHHPTTELASGDASNEDRFARLVRKQRETVLDQSEAVKGQKSALRGERGAVRGQRGAFKGQNKAVMGQRQAGKPGEGAIRDHRVALRGQRGAVGNAERNSAAEGEQVAVMSSPVELADVRGHSVDERAEMGSRGSEPILVQPGQGSSFDTNIIQNGAEVVSAGQSEAKSMSIRESSTPLVSAVLSSSCSLERMIALSISQAVIDSALDIYYKSNALSFSIQKLPSSFPFQLNTRSWRFLLPSLYRQYPNKDMELAFVASSMPNITLSHMEGIASSLEASFYLRVLLDTQETPKDVLCIDIALQFSAMAALRANNLTASAHLVTISVDLRWSTVGNIPQSVLEGITRALTKVVLMPLLNLRLAIGFPLPSIPGVMFSNSNVVYKDGFLEVCADLEYTGGIFMKRLVVV